MHNKWVVVLNRSIMKVFEERNQHLFHLKSLRNNLLSYTNTELGRHRPGAIFEGGRQGTSKHVMSGSTPRELSVESFARRMARFLDNARKRNLTSRLVIISEPKLMGLLRKHFSHPDFELTTQWITKDLAGATTEHLEEVLRQ